MKYLVVTSCDERYDFNLTMRMVDVDNAYDIFSEEGLDTSKVEVDNKGVYRYHTSDRDSNIPCCTGITEEDWEEISKKVERVTFYFCIAIPFDLLISEGFYVEDYIVHRNSKHGFLDGKSLN